MFATKDINKFFDIDIAMSNDMVNSIDLWNKILENLQWALGEGGVVFKP